MLTFHEHLSSPLVLNCPCLFSFIVVLSFSIYLLLLIISWYLLTLHRKKKSSKIKHKNNCVLVHNLGQIFIPPLPEGGGEYTVLPLSVLPSVLLSVQDIFRRIFLSNCWWQKSDIWSQASYRYTILWVAFLDPSDSYFLFADFVDFYTHWTYNVYGHFSSHFSQQLLMAEIWYLVTSFI